MKPSVLVTRNAYPDIVDRLRTFFTVTINDGERYLKQELINALHGKDGVLLSWGEKIDEEVATTVKGLKIICVTAAGYNNVDVAACTRAGIMVTNAPNTADETVADFAWCLLIAASRNMTKAERFVRAGQWNTSVGSMFYGVDVHGKTIGIIGLGGIGKAIARRAVGFNMNVIYYNRNRLPNNVESRLNVSYKAKDNLLEQADFVILALPFAKENYHTIGERELNLMKPSAVLINIARGGLIDEVALAKALSEKRIAAAALDVFEDEPKIYAGLMNLDNLILTPHIAGATFETQHGLANVAADNLIAALGSGESAVAPPALLNPEVLQHR